MAEKGLDTPVQLVFISVVPERDTVARRKDYVGDFSPAFIGAISRRAKLATLATQMNVTFGQVPGTTPDSHRVDQPTNLVLINPNDHY